MFLTHIVIAITLYALFNASVKSLSSIESWNKSIFKNIAKRFPSKKESQEEPEKKETEETEELEMKKAEEHSGSLKSWWGPRPVTITRKPVLGFIEDIKDAWSTFRLLQVVSILYPLYVVLSQQYGWFLALIALAIGYGFYLIATHVMYNYGVSTTRSAVTRLVVILGMGVFFTVVTIKLNQQGMPYMISKADKEIEQYEELVDLLNEENKALLAVRDSSVLRVQRLNTQLDSLANKRYSNEEEYNKALNFLKDFISDSE